MSMLSNKYEKLTELNNNISQAAIGKIMFWVGFSCVFISNIFDTMCFDNILSGGIVFRCGLFVLMAKIVIDWIYENNYTKLLYLASLIAGIGALVTSEESVIISLFVVILSSKNINYKHIIKFFTLSICGLYILNVVYMIIGIKSMNIMIDNSIGHGGSARHFFGFEDPNGAMMMATNIFICIVLLFKEKLSWILIGIETMIVLAVYYYTEARGGIMVYLIILSLFFIGKSKLKELIVKCGILYIGPVVIVVSMFVTSVIFDGRWLIGNKFLATFESRILAFGILKDVDKVTLFGRKVSYIYPVDCVYFKIILYYGIVSFLMFFMFYIIAIKRNVNDYYFGIVVFTMAFVGTLQTHPLEVYYSLPLLAAFSSYEDEELGDSLVDELKRYGNFIFSGAIIVLLTGHAIIQHGMEVAELNNVMYTGPSNRQVTDILFLILGAALGGTVKKIESTVRKG